MSAIITKYLGPTNFRGARVKASTGDNNPATGKPDTLTVEWDHAVNVNVNHEDAAKALAEKLGWNGAYFSGGMVNGMAFVRVFNLTFKDQQGAAFYVAGH